MNALLTILTPIALLILVGSVVAGRSSRLSGFSFGRVRNAPDRTQVVLAVVAISLAVLDLSEASASLGRTDAIPIALLALFAVIAVAVSRVALTAISIVAIVISLYAIALKHEGALVAVIVLILLLLWLFGVVRGLLRP